jgi:hypothetical protein
MQRFGLFVVVLASAAAAGEKAPGPRAVAERYVAAALAGKVDAASKLAVEGKSPAGKERIEEFQSQVDAKTLKLPAVWADEEAGQAVALSEPVKLANGKPGRDGVRSA